MNRKFILLTLSVLIFVSCNNSLQNIFDELNEKCELTVSDKENKSIYDEDFSEEQMITSEVYTIYEDSIFILMGPKDGTSYEWKITVPKTKKHPVTTYTICNNETLSYELPGVLESGVENELTFVVKNKDGKELIDKAKIILISR